MGFAMNSIVVEAIDQFSKHLDHVRDLADRNSATLGFLPFQAFRDFAARKQILIALDNDVLAGYLLYRIVQERNCAVIVHLCVEGQYRGKGITKQLFEELRKRTQALSGIRLRCRRDYEIANQVWRNLGFTPLSEMAGRSRTKQTTLTNWWYPHGHPTLFDRQDNRKSRIAIDANVFFDLIQTKGADREIAVLQSDWLTDEIELVVTPELWTEINRSANSKARDAHRNEAQRFERTIENRAEHDKAYANLLPLYPVQRDTRDESDLRQVAWAVADPDVAVFLTRDENLLSLASKIYDATGLSLMRPVDLILRVDEISRFEEYRNMRVAGTNIRKRRLLEGEPDKLARLFQNTNSEKLSDFKNQLRQLLVQRETHSGFVIETPANESLMMIFYDRSQGDCLNIPIFRITQSQVNKKLIKYMLLQIIGEASIEKRSFVTISDPALQDPVKECLQDDSFLYLEGTWTRISIAEASSATDVARRIADILSARPTLEPYYQLLLQSLESQGTPENASTVAEVERRFWPVKIIDSEIDNITIPIRAIWAYLWFDENLAVQTLFGAMQERAFNREGVYYSAAEPPPITLPARIVWYITKDEKVIGSQSLRACSRLDDIIVGTPKDLYRSFRHLGIWEWRNIQHLVRKDTKIEITAYRFSDTLLFPNPVRYSDWASITKAITGKRPPIQSPARMPGPVFSRVYRLGMMTEEDIDS